MLTELVRANPHDAILHRVPQRRERTHPLETDWVGRASDGAVPLHFQGGTDVLKAGREPPKSVPPASSVNVPES